MYIQKNITLKPAIIHSLSEKQLNAPALTHGFAIYDWYEKKRCNMISFFWDVLIINLILQDQVTYARVQIADVTNSECFKHISIM